MVLTTTITVSVQLSKLYITVKGVSHKKLPVRFDDENNKAEFDV